MGAFSQRVWGGWSLVFIAGVVLAAFGIVLGSFAPNLWGADPSEGVLWPAIQWGLVSVGGALVLVAAWVAGGRYRHAKANARELHRIRKKGERVYDVADRSWAPAPIARRRSRRRHFAVGLLVLLLAGGAWHTGLWTPATPDVAPAGVPPEASSTRDGFALLAEPRGDVVATTVVRVNPTDAVLVPLAVTVRGDNSSATHPLSMGGDGSLVVRATRDGYVLEGVPSPDDGTLTVAVEYALYKPLPVGQWRVGGGTLAATVPPG